MNALLCAKCESYKGPIHFKFNPINQEFAKYCSECLATGKVYKPRRFEDLSQKRQDDKKWVAEWLECYFRRQIARKQAGYRW